MRRRRFSFSALLTPLRSARSRGRIVQRQPEIGGRCKFHSRRLGFRIAARHKDKNFVYPLLAHFSRLSRHFLTHSLSKSRVMAAVAKVAIGPPAGSILLLEVILFRRLHRTASHSATADSSGRHRTHGSLCLSVLRRDLVGFLAKSRAFSLIFLA